MLLPRDRRRASREPAHREKVYCQNARPPAGPVPLHSSMSPYGERPSNTPPDNRLNEEAAEWSLRMSASEPDLDDAPYSGTRARNTAFLEWCSQSSEHLQAFLDMCEIDYRAQRAHFPAALTAEGKVSPRTGVHPGIKLALAASIALVTMERPAPDSQLADYAVDRERPA